MNDYIQLPDGQRVRYIRPADLQPPRQVLDGQLRAPGVAHIDQWMPAETSEKV